MLSKPYRAEKTEKMWEIVGGRKKRERETKGMEKERGNEFLSLENSWLVIYYFDWNYT